MGIRQSRTGFDNLSIVLLCGFIVVFILSTLLIFLIDLWIVLIINACEIVLYRIVFREVTIPEWLTVVLYITVCGMSIGIMLLVMYFPDKICDGTLQYASDMEYVKKYFGESYLIKERTGGTGFLGLTPIYTYTGIKSDGLIKGYHTSIGILSVFLLIRYIIFGIYLIYKQFIEYLDISIAFYSAIPLESLGGLIIANLPWNFKGLIVIGFVYGSVINLIQIILFYVHNPNSGNEGGSGRDYGGDSEKTYHIFIVED